MLVVGRLKEGYLREAEAEYRKRLRPHCTLEVSELKDESELIAAVPERARLLALDERGEQLSSAEFAAELGRGGHLVLAIGGADGHSEAVRRRADRLIAFGRMTIAHRLVRLILLEQIYRGFTILGGHPYHR